ncbi:hypothetical protein LINPERPRIM_LOCUS21594 [Linum perenne]
MLLGGRDQIRFHSWVIMYQRSGFTSLKHNGSKQPLVGTTRTSAVIIISTATTYTAIHLTLMMVVSSNNY